MRKLRVMTKDVGFIANVPRCRLGNKIYQLSNFRVQHAMPEQNPNPRRDVPRTERGPSCRELSGGSVGQVSGDSRCSPRFERRLDGASHLLHKRSASALGLLKKNQATKPLPEVELCPSPHRPTHRNPVYPVRTHTGVQDPPISSSS